MSADPQEIRLTPPVLVLRMLEKMIRDLILLHRRIVVTIHRGVYYDNKDRCDEIRATIEDTETELRLLVPLRDASQLMLPLFSETELRTAEASLEMITVFEEEVKDGAEWLQEVLETCAEPE